MKKKDAPQKKPYEIKFRGKRIDNGEWVYGYFYTIQNIEHYILVPCIFGVEHIQVVPETVGQFIGYSPKHNGGQPLYVGDIIKCKYGTFEVIYRDGGGYGYEYDVTDTSYTDWANGEWFEGFEVVANIHDNPNYLSDLEANKNVKKKK